MNNTIRQELQITRESRAQSMQQKPFVIWLTGLSGSGKSTLANALDVYFFNEGFHSYLLDGDNLRFGLNKDLGFDDESRVENIRRIGEVAKLMLDAGLIVIAAFISPFRTDRDMVRQMIGPKQFVEVFLNSPLEICEKRDSKGLYKKARKGMITNFTGIDSPYEPPQSPELILNSAQLSIQHELTNTIQYLTSNNYLAKLKLAVI